MNVDGCHAAIRYIIQHLTYIHRIVYDMTCPLIQKLFEFRMTISWVSRDLQRPYPVYQTNTNVTESSLIHKGTLLYNMLPSQFKSEIIQFIKLKLPSDKIINCNDIA